MEIGTYYFHEEKLKFAVVEELESSILRGYSYLHFPTPSNSRIGVWNNKLGHRSRPYHKEKAYVAGPDCEIQ